MEIANGLIEINWFSLFTGFLSIAITIGAILLIVHYYRKTKTIIKNLENEVTSLKNEVNSLKKDV